MAASTNVNNDNENSSSPVHPLTVNNETTANSFGRAHTVTTRNYTLNINRSLKRKIQGCEKVNVEYEIKEGGVTGTLDTASFELFRLACTEFFKEMPPEEGRCVVDYSEDKRRKALVQQTYKVTSPASERLYTLNLYPTNNTMLLNGKRYGKFIEEHLPTIHQIMCRAVQDQDIGSVAKFNEILGTQMQKVLDDRLRLNDAGCASSAPPPNTVASPASAPRTPQTASCAMNTKEEEDVTCLGCKRQTKSRGAYCEAGSHWIHYFCDKLTESDIDRLHNDPGFIYVCKLCATLGDDTNLKTPISPNAQAPGAPQSLLVLPKISSNSLSEEGSAAAGILEEETGSECQVCQTGIEESPNRCDSCQAECHDSCMVHVGDDSEMCLSCAATQAQLDACGQAPSQEVITQATVPDRQVHETSSGESPSMQPVPATQRDHEAGIQHADHVVKGSPANKTATGENSAQRNGTRVKDKKSSDSQTIKQRELRQMECKLKKWEEDLKLQEARTGSKNVDSRKLEDYLQKTEARNVELEATIRTLQRKICLQVEKDNPILANVTGPPGIDNLGPSQKIDGAGQYEVSYPNGGAFKSVEDPVCKSNNDLIRGIHKQVTSFVLKKVAQQISYLENMDQVIQNQQSYQQCGVNLQNHYPGTNSILNQAPNFNYQQMTNFNPRLNPNHSFNPSFNPQQMTNFNPNTQFITAHNQNSNSEQQPVLNSNFNSQQTAGFHDGYRNTEQPDKFNKPTPYQSRMPESDPRVGGEAGKNFGRHSGRRDSVGIRQRSTNHTSGKQGSYERPQRHHSDNRWQRCIDSRQVSDTQGTGEYSKGQLSSCNPGDDRITSEAGRPQSVPTEGVLSTVVAAKQCAVDPAREVSIVEEENQTIRNPKHYGPQSQMQNDKTGSDRKQEVGRVESPGGEVTAFNAKIQRLEDHPKPITPEQAGVLSSVCITPEQTSEGQGGSSFTAEGPAVFYSDRQPRDGRRHGANHSFLFKARPRRGRL